MKKKALLILICALVIFNGVIWFLVFKKDSSELTIAFLNVGQGDAIFIEAPDGNQMLIDGGNGGSVLQALSDVMPFYDRFIDVVVATHPDADHIGGLIDVFERFNISFVIESGNIGDTETAKRLEKEIAEAGAARFLARRGMSIDLGNGVVAHVLFPDRDVSEIESNTASVVLQIVYGETEILLTGDSPKSIEKLLVSQNKNLKSDILKIGHHGSRTSTDPSFLAAVAPTIGVISAGKDNRYGHPHQEVVELLQNQRVRFFETKDGHVVFTSNGKVLELK